MVIFFSEKKKSVEPTAPDDATMRSSEEGLLALMMVASASLPEFFERPELEPWRYSAMNAEPRRWTPELTENWTDGKGPFLTIATRSGFRPECLSNLMASLAAQKGVQFLQFVSNDAGVPGRAAIEGHIFYGTGNRSMHDIRIVDVDRSKFKNGKCYSTKYLKVLYALAPDDSWIVTLDDDARLTNEWQLRRIQEAVKYADPQRDILLQDAFLGKYHVLVYPNYTKDYGDFPKIDTANTIFHKSAAMKLLFLNGKCGGDKKLFLQLLSKNYRIRHISQPQPGVWANYDGQAKQELSVCDVMNLAPGERQFLLSPAYQGARLEPNQLLIKQAQDHYARLRRHPHHLRSSSSNNGSSIVLKGDPTTSSIMSVSSSSSNDHYDRRRRWR